MFDGMLEGLAQLTPEVFAYMILGIIVSTIIVIIPGLGGLFALAVMLPLAFTLEPVQGIAMLVAVSVVSGTGNTITSVLFGVPGSPGGVASILDGYPMARKGLGARAVAAGIGASVVGGLVGAAFLAVLLPVMRPLVLALGAPEFFVMIMIALIFMAYVGQGSLLRSIVAGGLGLMLSFVGLEQSTATQRFTFDVLYLWNGIQLVPMMIGLFAIAEMIELMKQGGSISQTGAKTSMKGQVGQGLRDVGRHWKTTAQSSATGLWVGIAPGMGDAAAQFIAYTQAARSSKHPEKFGTGIVEGIIASDAATNSKEGGALIPTLAFGIPGSSSMAVLLAAFVAFGIRPGADMLVSNVHIVWMIIWILVFGNLIAGLVCLSFIKPFAKLTTVRASVLVPPILVICLFGSYATTNNIGDVWVALVFGLVGYLMKVYGYSRATLLIGFVLGELLERNYLLSMRLFGLEFLLRPITMGLIALAVFILAWPVIRRTYRSLRRPKGAGSGAPPAETDTSEASQDRP
jgi:putative tricarboxylic transport membrane protein